jgi:aminoglycoside phosphotransferase
LEKPEGGWLEAARARVQAGVQSHTDKIITYPHSPFVGQRYTEVTAWVENTHTEPRLAFCHGDACVPNFMTDGGTITGVVDWGDGGWADPRFDLATTLWSLRRNGASGYQESFLAGYGWEGGVASLRLFEAFYTLWE